MSRDEVPIASLEKVILVRYITVPFNEVLRLWSDSHFYDK